MKLFKLSPQAGIRGRRQFVPREFCYPSGPAQELSTEDYVRPKSFLEAWFEDDAAPGQDGNGARVNWGAVSGMVLSLAVSASFWTGIVVLVERVWK